MAKFSQNLTLPPIADHLRSCLSLGTIAALGLAFIPVVPAQATIPIVPSKAPSSGAFQRCAASLTEAGITAADAASACATTLHPKDLGNCVKRIDKATALASEDILHDCGRVRRPVDMAKCVTSIHNSLGEGVGEDALSHCRQSLLPQRFANCVLGLKRRVDLEAPQLFSTCIDGRDRPLDIAPSFDPVQPAPSESVPPEMPADVPTPTPL